MKKIILEIKIYVVYMLYSIAYFFVKTKKYNIISNEETIKKVVDEGYSISRFGDGEFKWLLGIKQNSFQDDNILLSKKLNEVLCSEKKDTKILIGIPIAIETVKEYTYNAKKYWKIFWVNELKNIKPYLIQSVYCNTNITRPYMDYKDKNPEKMREKFENLKKIWEKRDVVIIEGEKTKLGVGNDLFDNCTSIQRIICPSQNAFDKYEEILEEALKCEKTKMFLISLGPTATVLAYELANKGYQAIDTGHIDIEYMWFKNNSIKKEAVKGKYVNEAKNNDLSEIKDEKYEKEIIACIGLR